MLKGLSEKGKLVILPNCVLPPSAHACLLRAITFHDEAHQSCLLARPPMRPYGLSLFFFPPFSFFVLPSLMKTNERTNDHPSRAGLRCHLCPNAEIIHLRTLRRQVFRCPHALLWRCKQKSGFALPSWERGKGESRKTISPSHSAP